MNNNQTKILSNYLLVSSFEELFQTSYHDQVNAIGWNRTLEGNFEEIVQQLILQDSITEVTIADLLQLDLTDEGKVARSVIIEDYKNLELIGAQPVLNLLKSYPRDTEFDFISTDVYSFHVDRSPISTDTILCTYHGSSSDIIRNEEVVQMIQVPSIRQQLFELYDGDLDGFEDFLIDNYFDMHYAELPNAKPYNLGNGNMWRLAVDHPDLNVQPCVHRAPKEADGKLRLLLIC